MTQNTFYKKYTIQRLLEIAELEKILINNERVTVNSVGISKGWLVNILYPIYMNKQHGKGNWDLKTGKSLGGDPKGQKLAEVTTKEKRSQEPDQGNTTPARTMEDAEDSLDPKDLINFVFSEGILYKVDGHCWWGKSSKLRDGEVPGDKDVLTGVKTLVDPKSLAGLRSYRSAAERIVKRRAYSFLGLRGVYFVPRAFISGIEQKLVECQANFDQERKEFIEDYPKLKIQWRKKSGKLYDESLYPSATYLESTFRLNWTKFMISLPDSNLGILTDEELQEELKKQKENMRQFLDTSLQTLAVEFVGIVAELKDKVDRGDTINKKRLATIKTFFQEFESMNITKNPQLNNLATKFGSLIGKKDAEDFEEKKFQTMISKEAKSIVNTVKKSSQLKRALEF